MSRLTLGLQCPTVAYSNVLKYSTIAWYTGRGASERIVADFIEFLLPGRAQAAQAAGLSVVRQRLSCSHDKQVPVGKV
jgi:hypothetical protein